MYLSALTTDHCRLFNLLFRVCVTRKAHTLYFLCQYKSAT